MSKVCQSNILSRKSSGVAYCPQDMIALARKNAALKGFKPPQVAFVQTSLTESLPIESNSVDCILSNCVVNLLPMEGKANLLKEVYRILKSGGRVVIDDVTSSIL